MKKIIWLLAVFSLCLSCNNDDKDLPAIAACDVNNPIEDLDWLKARAQEIKDGTSDLAQYFYIEMAEYKGKTVFIGQNCCPYCSSVILVYDCEGKELGSTGTEILASEISNAKIIFKAPNFSCGP